MFDPVDERILPHTDVQVCIRQPLHSLVNCCDRAWKLVQKNVLLIFQISQSNISDFLL